MSNSSARPQGARTRKIGAVVATLAVIAGLSFGGVAASAVRWDVRTRLDR